MNKESITFEVVAHYQFPWNPNTGTFHVFWEEAGADIRGNYYSIAKDNKVLIKLPTYKAIDEGKPVHYTAIAFVDAEFHKRFFSELRKTFIEYMKQEKLQWVEFTPRLKPKFTPKKKPKFKSLNDLKKPS